MEKARKKTDWGKVKLYYESVGGTNASIAKVFKLNADAVRMRAKREGWKICDLNESEQNEKSEQESEQKPDEELSETERKIVADAVALRQAARSLIITRENGIIEVKDKINSNELKAAIEALEASHKMMLGVYKPAAYVSSGVNYVKKSDIEKTNAAQAATSKFAPRFVKVS